MIEGRPRFETFEHTADVGLLARGRTLEELFVNAAQGLVELTIDPVGLRADTSVRVHVSANDRDALLVSWLNELLFLLDTRGFLPRQVAIEHLCNTEVDADLMGDTIDSERHRVRRMIKAATYHQLTVHKVEGLWEARVILDL